MLDSVGIRLPKYKVRELTIELQKAGDLQGDTVDKMMFLQVNVECDRGRDVSTIILCIAATAIMKSDCPTAWQISAV